MADKGVKCALAFRESREFLRFAALAPFGYAPLEARGKQGRQDSWRCRMLGCEWYDRLTGLGMVTPHPRALLHECQKKGFAKFDYWK